MTPNYDEVGAVIPTTRVRELINALNARKLARALLAECDRAESEQKRLKAESELTLEQLRTKLRAKGMVPFPDDAPDPPSWGPDPR